MPKIIAEYTYEHNGASLRPKDQLWGVGTVPLDVDHEPTTQEDFDEISRYIATEVVKDCAKLVLNRVYADPSIDIIEGELVEDDTND